MRVSRRAAFKTFLAATAAGMTGAAAYGFLYARHALEVTDVAVLVLSGHTHGGQVVLPIVGAVAAQKFPVVAGLGRRSRTTIFVSRGVGTVFVPVRLNCPPEVAVLTLTAV